MNGKWIQQKQVPWKPRVAHACAAHRQINASDQNVASQYLFVVGGWDGTALDDVWRMDTSGSWVQMQGTSAWSPRAWHSIVSFESQTPSDILYGPRLWLIGGSITGDGINQMHTYTDIWFTRDGQNWTAASSDVSGMSTAEWSIVTRDNQQVCVGKWGHSVIPFWRSVKKSYRCNSTCRTIDNTTSLSGQIIPICDDQGQPEQPYDATVERQDSITKVTLYPDGCDICPGTEVYDRFVSTDVVPALLLIAGSAGSEKTNDVFISSDARK